MSSGSSPLEVRGASVAAAGGTAATEAAGREPVEQDINRPAPRQRTRPVGRINPIEAPFRSEDTRGIRKSSGSEAQAQPRAERTRRVPPGDLSVRRISLLLVRVVDGGRVPGWL